MGIAGYAGRIGKVISHEIKKVVELIAETRKGYNQKGVLYNSSGEDSPPVKDDKLVLLKIDGTGKYVVVGILTESQGAKPGEKIFYARDDGGDIKSKLSMLGDGDVTLKNEKDLTVTIKGDITIEGKGAINENGGGDITKETMGKYTIHGKEILINGDIELILKTIGAVMWCPNGVVNCYICGAPHGGPAMGITGLKGA